MLAISEALGQAMRIGRLALVLLAGCEAADDSPPAASACPEGQVDDDGTCVPERCGTGRWGSAAGEATELVYVDGDYTGPGSNGTESAPFQHIAEGIDAAPSGGRVVVAPGVYEENIEITHRNTSVFVAGRCADLVTLDGSANPGVGTLGVTFNTWRDTFGLGGMTLTGGQYGGFLVFGGNVALLDSVISDVAVVGVFATDATLYVSDTVISGIEADSSGDFGRGIDAEDGATLVVEDTLVEGMPNAGIFAADEHTTVTLRDVTIRETGDTNNGGLYVVDGATVTATDLVVENTTGIGVFAASSGTDVSLHRVEVRDVRPWGEDGKGVCLDVEDAARMDVRDATLERCREAAIEAFGSGTELSVSTSSIRDTLRAGLEFGRGIEINTGASVTLSETTISTCPDEGLVVLGGSVARGSWLTVEGNGLAGVHAEGDGTVVELENSVSRGTVASDGWSGAGVAASGGASVTLASSVVEDTIGIGVFVWGSGTEVTLNNVQIRGTLAQDDGTDGKAVGVEDGGHLLATGLDLDQNTQVALFASGAGSEVAVEGGTIVDTAPAPGGPYGRGVGAQAGARIDLVGVTIDGASDVGVGAYGADTIVTLDDVVVRAVSARPDGTSGNAVRAQTGARLEATNTLIEDTTGDAVVASSSATVILTEVVITDVHGASDTLWGTGVLSQGATLTASDLSVSNITGPGLYASGGGALTCTRCAISACTFTDVVVTRGTLTLADSSLTSEGDLVAAAMAFDAFGTPTLTINNSDIASGRLASVWLDGPGAYTLSQNTFDSEQADPGGTLHGNALYATRVDAWDDTTELGLWIEGDFGDFPGPPVLLHGASARFGAGTVWSGVDSVWQQDCGGVTTPPPGLTTSSALCPATWGLVVPLDWRIYTTEDETEG